MEKKKSKVVDVTTKKGTVETLTEAKITCAKEEKVHCMNEWMTE